MSRRSGSPTMVATPTRVEPARLSAEQLRDVSPGGQEPLIEVEVVGDLAHHARAHGDGRRRRRRLPALGGHPYLLGWQGDAALDGPEDLGRHDPVPGAGRRRPGCVEALRRCGAVAAKWPADPRSESTMRRGRLVSAAVRSRHAATSCATARERRDMLRMSPSFHQASSGTRAGVRSPSTSSHSLRAHSNRPSARRRSVSTARSSRRWATSLTA